MKDVLCLILGGGRGTRLYPLTKYRAKPAVPIAGKYRLIDIPISNCLNSGFNKISILTQFNSESLNKHISRAYKLDFFSGGFVEIIAADQSMDHLDWFQGSADAVRKCLKHFNDSRIRYIMILSGDQLYRMNLLDFLIFHIEKNSDITVACNTVDVADTHELGVMGVNEDFRIKHFIEKPKSRRDIDTLAFDMDGKQKFLASMGIYVFTKDVLFDLLTSSAKVDFGKEIIPDALVDKRTHAYIHKGYWKDIGSIKSFYEENLAFTGLNPPLDLFDENWQFFTRPRYLPLSKIIKSQIEMSNIAEGALIEESSISHSIIGLRSKIGSNSIIEDSIVMGSDYYEDSAQNYPAGSSVPPLGIGKNCHIRKTIVDKNVRIGDHVAIVNKSNALEFENKYCVIRNGIIIIPKNTVIPSGTVI
ncbi:MAG: glucose-1-phosphate adenylyltransferase [Candidatus Omnitrophota bacterium]